MKFKDVPKNHWGISGIKWTVDNNVMSGRGEGIFAPNDNITRAEFANALMRYHLHMVNELPSLQDMNIKTTKKNKPAIIVIESDNSIGSGFFITDDGCALTNFHVIADENNEISKNLKAKVLLKDNTHTFETTTNHEVEVIAYDSWEDLALIKVNIDKPVHYLNLADKQPPEGSFVLSMGHPFGYQFTTNFGIISQDCQLLGFWGMMQSDAAISGGNSGGALVSVYTGELVGIPTRKAEKKNGRIGEGLNFSIPLINIKAFIEKHLNK